MTPPATAPTLFQTITLSIATPSLSQLIVLATTPASTLSIVKSPITALNAIDDGKAPTKETLQSHDKWLNQALTRLCEAPKTVRACFESKTSNNTASYTLCKKKLLAEFIEVVEDKGDKYDYLLVRTKGKACSNIFPKDFEGHIVFSMVSGPEFKAKKVKILNDILIDWVSDKKKLAKNITAKGYTTAYPTPATLNSMIRAFLAAVKDQFKWEFSTSNFNFEGGYNGFVKALCKEQQKKDVSVHSSSYILFKNIILTSHH